MAEEIFGPFDSVEDTVKTVNILELEGYSNTNITIFAHGKYADKLNDQTDVSVTSFDPESTQDQSFLEKIKKVFFNDIHETDDLYGHLLDRGLSEDQAKDYSNQVQSGKIVITAENEWKMGNDPTDDTIKMKEKVDHLYQ
ncbi:general stress protein [Lentibacillus cibarius]|uniref:general stress protein n=1 Tax=Lentibacillus cibarius TaxID=2583219 RepID=UPI00163D3D99|nr:general stress protein [Lentibacillus cibarius]